MKRSIGLLVAVAQISLVALTSVALGNPGPEIWYDDMEGDVSGWATADLTAGESPHFHWDTYAAYEGISWWCGNFDYDSDGGYGNNWDDRLSLPEIAVNPVVVENITWGALKARYRGSASGNTGQSREAVVPVLTFAYRHDSEIGYDFTYVQAESNGVFVDLNGGYDGRQDWTDLGPYGYDLSSYDDPLRVRFRFLSDGAWSDEDGLYLSQGGAFAVDNVKVYDFATGEILFYDSEPGLREGECIPGVTPAAGDYWHVIDRACPAFSDPHCWWCGDDADTSHVPPNLQNVLFSPLVYVAFPQTCMAYLAMHFAVPTVDNDYVVIYGSVGGSYYGLATYWGDFGTCDGWGSTSMNDGFDIGQFASNYYDYVGMAFVMYTTDDGCGPGEAGDAGVMLDDLWFCTLGGIRIGRNARAVTSTMLSPIPVGAGRPATARP